MMENKETEKFIEKTLNSEKPNRRVLSAAKMTMEENNPSRTKRPLWFFVSATCSIVLIAIGIFFVVPVRDGDDTFPLLGALEDTSFMSYGLILGIVLIIAGLTLGIIALVLGVKKIKRK